MQQDRPSGHTNISSKGIIENSNSSSNNNNDDKSSSATSTKSSALERWITNASLTRAAASIAAEAAAAAVARREPNMFQAVREDLVKRAKLILMVRQEVKMRRIEMTDNWDSVRDTQEHTLFKHWVATIGQHVEAAKGAQLLENATHRQLVLAELESALKDLLDEMFGPDGLGAGTPRRLGSYFHLPSTREEMDNMILRDALVTPEIAEVYWSSSQWEDISEAVVEDSSAGEGVELGALLSNPVVGNVEGVLAEDVAHGQSGIATPAPAASNLVPTFSGEASANPVLGASEGGEDCAGAGVSSSKSLTAPTVQKIPRINKLEQERIELPEKDNMVVHVSQVLDVEKQGGSDVVEKSVHDNIAEMMLAFPDIASRLVSITTGTVTTTTTTGTRYTFSPLVVDESS